MTAQVGSPAPDFALVDQARNEVTLAELRGKKSLIVFIPSPFTGICDAEACALRDNLSSLRDLDANVVVITAHARPTNKKWAEEEGFGFPVLSDFWPHGAVASAYGAFNEALGVPNRVTYVLDADGVVREIIATDSLGTAREFAAYTEALTALG
ncbi:MAG: redoxin domain-containing protein [Acidimicrobiia bacterium]|jgi:mycoredoxin-dependent peroxiredoxin